ncbi:MAG: hypothetical protein HY466_05175, partial [Deltaproteobacteria bacterium]|nr:hypothetical protein [Deltaproteobacteria bacterium]
MREYFFPLKDRKKIAEDTFGFWLDTSGTDYTFIPGQYAAFTIKEETKVFTLA